MRPVGEDDAPRGVLDKLRAGLHEAAEPEVVIEAKITDDGTARDKVARILRLAGLGRRRAEGGGTGFQIVACIDGRGFGVRRQDMRDLLTALDGKVFILTTLDQLVPHTRLVERVSR